MDDVAPPAEAGPGARPATVGRSSYTTAVEVAVERSTIAGHGLSARAPVAAGAVVLVFDRPVRAADDFAELNHSCDANLGLDDDDRTLVALRDIPRDAELTVDYSTAIDDPSFVLWCHCGSTRCRQAVEGTDWQIPQLQARYAGHWSPRIAARFAG